MEVKLFQKSEKEYGEYYKPHLLEQYRLYIQSAEKISDRRQNANNHFLAINTVLVSFLALSFDIDLFKKMVIFRIILSIAGILICMIFGLLLNSYKQLNSGKFKVIHEIEQNIPLSLYSYEWEMLGKGKNKKLYYPFSHIELLIPWVFGIVYVVLMFILFFYLCK